MKKYIFVTIIFIVLVGFMVTIKSNGQVSGYSLSSVAAFLLQNQDSTQLKYPVKKTSGRNFEEINKSSTVDFKTPENIVTTIKYDPNTAFYYFVTKAGDIEIATPFSMSFDEYTQESLNQSMKDYFKRKNSRQSDEQNEKNDFSLKNVKVNVTPLDKIFGPGGVKVNASGFVETTMGIKRTFVNNPMLSANRRSKTIFDFHENIQLNMNATVGNTINFDMNYDTEAMFDFDTKRINLTYDAALAGDEDGILRKISAGNVTMPTTNSLIRGGTALFGITSELQFGRLKINTIISQQESQTYSTSTSGGVQKNIFEFKADNYDENRHFFLTQYFVHNYDRGMSKLPLVLSEVLITNIQVWITNTRGNTENSRDIIAFADLADPQYINNTGKWTSNTGQPYPYNEANTLYKTVVNQIGSRDINQITQLLEQQGLDNGQDYEKVESARLLDNSEYFYNEKLGYISLTSALQPDEVLAVSFTYTHQGKTYKVGELSSDISSPYSSENPQRTGSLFVKLLKPTSLSPESYSWKLMMKNVYSLGATNIQKEDFTFQVKYKVDSLGTLINYFPEGKMKNKLLIRVLGLDRLNKTEQERPDGIFDFLEGYTIKSSTGRIYFPHIEPFGNGLKDSIGDSGIADKYVFKDLYTMTKTQAQQNAQHNKFYLSGHYKGSNAKNEISLNAFNIPQGSVSVSVNGVALVENVDYIIDYSAGKVIIINQELINSQANIDVSYEGQSYTTQRKTLMGFNLSYDVNKNLNIGGTLLHYTEKPLISNLSYGQDAVKNTIWGLNASYATQSMWPTNLLNQIPYLNATAPSTLRVNTEFAQMIPGHYVNKNTGAYSYIDDFESARVGFDIKNPYAWSLSSTPTGSFSEGKLSNDITYGFNRAMMSWFTIDPLFTRKNSTLKPEHIDNDQLSDHFVREILLTEIYPSKDMAYNMSSVIYPLNISYYPEERGPYNLDAKNISSDGKLLTPEKRWGGMMRKLDVTDFDASNIEYIEFWLMDPFVNNENDKYVPNEGGKLVFNLGNISEDILKDGKKFYENGLPLDGNLDDVDFTVWGKVPKKQSMVYAFDNQDKDALRIQDVGLNGLSIAEELQYETYTNYLDELRSKISPNTLQEMLGDQFSPFNTPAKDKYHYYRGADYDREKLGILDRYKYYNNTEGNSLTEKDTGEDYSTAAKTTPDVEDINQDFTLNEQESYYQYEVELDPAKMNIGNNYIIDQKEVEVDLRNKTKGKVKWYQFRIPIKGKDIKKVGNISGFNSIRFARIYLTGFKQNTFLRFATMELVRGDWRVYNGIIDSNNVLGAGEIQISAINIEESSKRRPVNYILPPGVSRLLDPDQVQITQENEQSLMMTFSDVEPKNSKAIYKATSYDMRHFKRIQMFVHLENFLNSTAIKNGETSIFMRLGSDYKENYYEYEIPLTVTPPGQYFSTNTNDQLTVWPQSNMFDFKLALLKDIKLNRNKIMRTSSLVSFTTPYSEYDPDNQTNKVTVIGNPSLSDVDVIMIGVRNNSRENKSGVIWVDELRLTDFDEQGGWAVQGNLNLSLSDIAQFNFSGRKETVGFGSIEQSLLERRMDDYEMYNISTSLDIGRLLPEQVKLSVPFSLFYSKQTITPKYDPFDKDVTMKEALEVVKTRNEKDSIKSLAREMLKVRSFSFNNIRFNQVSKNPMPYDLSNFSFSYVNNFSETNTPELVYDKSLYYQFALNYSYSPSVSPWEPFKNIKGNKGSSKFLKNIGINFLPNNISFNSIITRNYTETLTRDLESYRYGGENNNFLSWSQSFFWDRDFNLSWNLTKNLKFNFQSGMKAEIEEPYLQVNKKMNRSAYDIWRDEVWRSIRSLGNPYSYRHNLGMTYQLPLNLIPALDWIQATNLTYKTDYTWDRGAQIDTINIGNTIQNNQTIEINSRVSLTNLYNKSKFLKRVNDRFDGRKEKMPPKPQRKTYKQTITLKTDTGIIVKHNLGTKRIDINLPKGQKLSYKKLDDNTIYIKTKDSISIPITLMTKTADEKNKFIEEFKEHTARGLMSVRSVNFLYSKRNETYLPSFIPGSGDLFGQYSTSFGNAPGLGFAFGLEGGESYINRSLRNDWLSLNGANLTPAIYNQTEKLNLQAIIEPFKGLTIQLQAAREQTQRTEFQFMFDGMPKVYGGSFSMTTISLASSFNIGKASNNYNSQSFQKFLDNRQIIANRIENQYEGIPYPSTGFLNNYPGLIGEPYDKAVSPVDETSADVLIPAFLSAYTGKNVKKIGLSPFPKANIMLPNWTLTYDVLTHIKGLKNQFRSLQVMHGYQSYYMVTGYNSFTDWESSASNMGFVPDILTGRPIPSSPYDITSVTLTESFNPLFGVNSTLNSGFLLNILYRRDRTLNLNISSYQIVESLTRDVILGTGYRFNNFNRLIGLNVDKRRRKPSKETDTMMFNNDLILKLDLSSKINQILIRKIQDNYTQATNGNTIFTLMFSAEYTVSREMTLRAFYDWIINKPLISATSFPISTTNFGISVRYTLSR